MKLVIPNPRWKNSLIRFAREIVAIPSPSGGEKQVLERIGEEMTRLGWEKVRYDRMGNLHGHSGNGKRTIALDGHADTVGPGALSNWSCDPYRGRFRNGWIWGRGTVDQKGGLAAAVYAAPLIRDFGLEGDFTLCLVASVQEEGSEGLNWDCLIDQEGFRPDLVVLTEPSNLKIMRGQKGRAEILFTARGISAHASCPERGKNAAAIICAAAGRLPALSARLRSHPAMGQGRISITRVRSSAPSGNSIPDLCRMLLDRRFVIGDTRRSILAEARRLCGTGGARVEFLRYRRISFTGYAAAGEKFFPSWLLSLNHPAIAAACAAAKAAWGKRAPVDVWPCSTNGVSIAGRHGIPAIGLGPGREEMAHAPDERVRVSDLVRASLFYAHFPGIYCRTMGHKM
ncbi:MAG: YgeY family selenium metabolism-linked hydrolase [Candidatus Aureabacteria bacterium]|nr:YgeY family selenium metabolism-linked hydrolase [Candidatus Auribacterota bacterium]